MVDDFGRTLAALERRIADLENNRTFRNVSIDGTNLPIYDSSGVLRQVIGYQDDGAYTVVDLNAPPPPMPSTPTVTSALGGLVIAWDGLSADGTPWPADFKCVEVHLGTAADFEVTDENQVGTFTSLLGGSWTVGGLDADTPYYAALVAVNTSGRESPQTPADARATGEIGSALDDGVIDQIRTETNTAIEAVRTRPHAYYGTVMPPPPEGGFADGDQWWVQDPTDGSFAGNRWDATANSGAGGWVPYQFGGGAIVANSISAAQIMADSIQAQHITAGAVTTQHLAAVAVTAEKIDAQAVTADKLAGALVIGSKVQAGATDTNGALIGQYSELSPEGIKNVGPDGVTQNLYFPNDPAKTAFVRAQLETGNLRVNGGLAIMSSLNEFSAGSTTALASGVSAPPAPQVDAVWDQVQLDVTTRVRAPATRRAMGDFGLLSFDPNLITSMDTGSNGDQYRVLTDHSQGTRLWTFNTDGTIMQDSNGYVVADYAGYHDATLGRFCILWNDGVTWYMYGSNTDGKWYNNKLKVAMLNGNQRPHAAYGLDAFGRLHYYVCENYNAGSNDNFVVRDSQFLPVDGVVTSQMPTVMTGVLGSGRNAALAGAMYAPGIATTPVGTNRWAYAAQNGTDAWVLNGDGTDANASYQFPLSGVPKAFSCTWDGQFVSLNNAGLLTLYTAWNWTDTKNTIYAGYTWYDDGTRKDATGNGVWHETVLGQVGKMTAKKRSKVRITVPPVPDKAGADDPNRFRLYVARATSDPGPGGMPRVFEGGSATVPTQVTLLNDPSGTNFAPPSPNPNDFPGASPAQLYSGMSDAAGRRKFLIDGFGQGRWPRMQPVGSIREWTGGTTPPEGWLFADGSAVSRTKYPELAAQYWNPTTQHYAHGDGDGLTTFNLPNMSGGYTDLTATTGILTAALGYKVNSQTFNRRNTVVDATFQIEVVTTQTNVNMAHADRQLALVTSTWRPVSDTALAQWGGGVRSAYLNATDGWVYVTEGFSTQTTFDLEVGQQLNFGVTYMLPVLETTPGRVRKIIYAGEGS